MESIFLPDADEAEPEAADQADSVAPSPAIPTLIFLESAEGAGVCDANGVCD